MIGFRGFPRRTAVRGSVAALLLTGVCGCASTRPIAYSGLQSSPHLRPASKHGSEKIPYSYTPPVEWRKYYKVILDPVVIYEGADAQFGKMRREDQAALAAYMDDQFHQSLGAAFEIVNRADRNTIYVRLTLTGAVPNKAVLGTLSRFDLAGGPYNAFQGIRGKEGTLTGSIIYVVEIYDSISDRLLLSQVHKQFPNALNIGASIGAMAAAKAGVRKGADELVRQLTQRSSNK